MTRTLRLVAASIGVVLVAYLATNFVYLPWRLAAVGGATGTVDFEIKTSEGVASVAARLAAAGLIADDWAFKRYLTRTGLDTQIQAGHFRLAGGQTAVQLAEQLLHGQAVQTKITFLEGWNSNEMDAELAQNKLLPPGEWARLIRAGGATASASVSLLAARQGGNLEGYFFPTTYFINPNNFTAEELLSRGLAQMQAELAKVGVTHGSVAVLGKQRSLHQLLTMASIVQLEERDPAQQKLVADLLWRRLDSGMQLGADATLFYALGGHREFLTVDDLKVESPYNTRRFVGLPPTPVASPGATALAAAVHPEPNAFWYYLHDSAGGIHFAKDLAGHNANKQKYLAGN